MLPPGWDASPSQGYPQHYAGTHLYTWVERGTVRVKCLAQERNTMSPARPRTQTTRSGVERTNHEATAPPTERDTLCSVQKVVLIHFRGSSFKNIYTKSKQHYIACVASLSVGFARKFRCFTFSSPPPPTTIFFFAFALFSRGRKKSSLLARWKRLLCRLSITGK